MDNHILNDDPLQSDNEGQTDGMAQGIVSAMPIPLFETKPYVVSELPASADLGTAPVVTLTFADRAQLKIEQTKLTIAVLKLAVMVISVIHTITGITVNEERWYLQRRVWASIFGVVVFVLGMLKVAVPEWLTTAAPDIAVQLAQGISGLIATILAAWSYIKPKA